VAGAYTRGLILVAIVYLVNGLIEFFHYFYRGLSRSDIESTLTLWQRGATLAFAAVALWWRPSLDALAIALGLPAAATLAYSARRALLLGRAAAARDDVVPPAAPSSSVISGRSFVSGRRVSAPASDSRPEAADDWQLASVWPIGAGIVLSALYFRVDVFLVEWWSGTKAVGLYNSAFRLVEALRLFPAAAVAVALPSLCRTRDYRPLLQLSTSVTVFAILGTAVLWVSASWLIPTLYGSAYVAAIPAFRILLLAFPLMSLNYALTHQLIGWNGHRFYAGLCATALVVNLASNARLIPALSIVGAAWSTLLTEVVITAGCAAALWTGSRTRTPQLAVSGGS
jgi:O-antigen/teichoic acid export membrane protein